MSKARRKWSAAFRRDLLARNQDRCANTDGRSLGFPCELQGRILRLEDVQVDHIVELGNGGADHRSNLQPLCAYCHDRKTRSFLRSRRTKTDTDVVMSTRAPRAGRNWVEHLETFLAETPVLDDPKKAWTSFGAWMRQREYGPAPLWPTFRKHWHHPLDMEIDDP